MYIDHVIDVANINDGYDNDIDEGEISHFLPPRRCLDLQPAVSAGSDSSGLRGTAGLHQVSVPGATAFHTGKTPFLLRLAICKENNQHEVLFAFPLQGGNSEKCYENIELCTPISR